MPDLNRRDFLKFSAAGLLTASGLLGLGGLFRFLSAVIEPAPKTEFDLGSASNYPLGSRTVISEVPALLIHAESGFSALSLVCTHLGCTVEEKDDGFACPCHGSLYAKDGRLLRGPAVQRLPILRIEVTGDENLILHTK